MTNRRKRLVVLLSMVVAWGLVSLGFFIGTHAPANLAVLQNHADFKRCEIELYFPDEQIQVDPVDIERIVAIFQEMRHTRDSAEWQVAGKITLHKDAGDPIVIDLYHPHYCKTIGQKFTFDAKRFYEELERIQSSRSSE